MLNLLGYLAYVLICSTGVIQASAMIAGKNFKYNLWTAINLEAGLILLQFTLGTGPAPHYVIVGNAVSVLANGVALWYMLPAIPTHFSDILDRRGEQQYEYEQDDTEDVRDAPLRPPLLIRLADHNHGPYGYRDGEPYYEHIEGCDGCVAVLFSDTEFREV